MYNIKLVIGICASVLAILALGYHINKRHKQQKDPSVLTIGILQTASHPALDAARKGFVDELTKNRAAGTVEIILQNGQGSVQQLHSMAQSLHSNKNIDAIYAIATPAAQAIAHAESHKPIIIAAVTDPHAAGLIHPGGNVCGTKDMVDAATTVQVLTTLVPKAKKVALVYNPGEVNSCVMVKNLEAELARVGIASLHVGITGEAEVPAAVAMACANADALLAPTDNLVALTMPLIADRAIKAKKPLIACFNEAVHQGALAACGVDYYVTGQQSARIALRVLVEGVKPSAMAIEAPLCDTVVLNKKTLDGLGIVMPKSKKEVRLIT